MYELTVGFYRRLHSDNQLIIIFEKEDFQKHTQCWQEQNQGIVYIFTLNSQKVSKKRQFRLSEF
jgi:hypothetical protein